MPQDSVDPFGHLYPRLMRVPDAEARALLASVKSFDVNQKRSEPLLVSNLTSIACEVYCRIFHPVQTQTPEGMFAYQSWADLLGGAGRLRSDMDLGDLVRLGASDIRRRRLRLNFEVGFIERPTFRAIASALENDLAGIETACLFYWWEGEYGWADINVFRGPLTIAEDLVPFDGGDFDFAHPTLWWAEDRSWFVCTHIDFDSTYVGGSAALVERVIRTSGLEAIRVEPGHRPPGRLFDELDYTELPG